MGTPVAQSEEYRQMKNDLETTCRDLASRYLLTAYTTQGRMYTSPHSVVMCPPVQGAIIFRDEAHLVALVETREHYDHQQKTPVIDRVVLWLYEEVWKNKTNMNHFADSFCRIYPDDFNLEDGKLGGDILIVKEQRIE